MPAVVRGTFAPRRRVRTCLRAATTEATRAGVPAPGPHLTEEPGRTAAGPVWLREVGWKPRSNKTIVTYATLWNSVSYNTMLQSTSISIW